MSLTNDDYKILLADVLIRQREIEIMATALATEVERLKKESHETIGVPRPGHPDVEPAGNPDSRDL